jgi:hypothetical protein
VQDESGMLDLVSARAMREVKDCDNCDEGAIEKLRFCFLKPFRPAII